MGGSKEGGRRSAWAGARQIESLGGSGGGEAAAQAGAGRHWGSGRGRRGWGQHIRSSGGVVRNGKKCFFLPPLPDLFSLSFSALSLVVCARRERDL
jgi:hypothetical protein